MRFHIIAAATLALGTTVAAAQEAPEENETRADEEVAAEAAPQPRAAEEEEDLDDGQEVVCRTERITGSLTRRRRTCMTRDEWTALEARTRDDMIRAGRNASGSPQHCNDPARPAC